MTNLSQEMKSKSFYGNSMKLSSKRSSPRYLTPLERKILREKRELIASKKINSNYDVKENIHPSIENELNRNSCDNKSFQNKSSSTKNITDSPSNTEQKNIKSGASGSILFAEKNFTNKNEKSTPSGNKSLKSRSRTINWAPTSLGKRYLQRSKSKYPHVQSRKRVECHRREIPPVDKLVRRHNKRSIDTSDTATSVLTNGSQGKCNEERDLSDGGDITIASVNQSDENPSKLARKEVASCVKELIYSQESHESSDSGVKLDEPSDDNDKNAKSSDHSSSPAQTKLFPIFQSKSPSVRSSPLLQSHTNKGAATNAVSPQSSHASLPGKSKTRQCVSPPGGDDQMIIDAGQKQFGATQCDMCGMVYTINHPNDQQQHLVYHKRFLSHVKFPGWKKERIVASYMDGRIVKVLSNDPKYATKKIDEIRLLIDTDLGFNQSRSWLDTTKVTYLYISDNCQIVGCLVAEPITHAYRLLPTHARGVITCSLDAERVTCGVSRIWTFNPHRRRGVASRLMDALRISFVLGSQLDCNQVAFSDPTPDGRNFAAKYCETDQFLTYNFVQ